MADAKSLGCQRVSFPGQLLGDAKDRIYAESDLFVLPTYSENFGIVVAEALSHSVPVVTTWGAPWQGLPENRCGWWTEIEEAKIHAALSEAMSKCRSELSDMGARGRDWMERDFSWPHIAEKTQTTFEWLLHGTARPSWVV
jgi:glycosyltransferase involved in cell wall biosynthesis